MYTCALCKTDFEYTSGTHHPSYMRAIDVYVERAISKKHFLCPKCFEAKLKVCDYGSGLKEKTEAANLLKGVVADKSDVLKNIVNAWIEGEEKNYYSDLKDLVYYVPGPVESLFVFKNHLTILSTFCDTYNDTPWDYVMFYEYKNEDDVYKNYFIEKKINRDTDLKTLKAEGLANPYNDNASCDTLLELNVSLGDYGDLFFYSQYGIEHHFKFYYHQNQLMEEVYNYIKMRSENPAAEDDTIPMQVANNEKNASVSNEENKVEQILVAFSAADEIRKMKELFDCGILSQEEFDEAKKRLISKL